MKTELETVEARQEELQLAYSYLWRAQCRNRDNPALGTLRQLLVREMDETRRRYGSIVRGLPRHDEAADATIKVLAKGAE